jgi:hypothetical protein
MTQTDEPLAEILAAIKFGDGAGAVVNAVEDLLAIADATFPHPTGQSPNRLFAAGRRWRAASAVISARRADVKVSGITIRPPFGWRAWAATTDSSSDVS